MILLGQQTELLDRYELIRRDPWEFCKQAVFTKDEVDKSNSKKRFPVHFPYIYPYIRVWQRQPLVVVPKSRRMFMTWTNISIFLWDTMFYANRFNVFQSKKEEDSDALLERAKFILDNIPPELIPRDLIPKYRKTYCRLEFPEIGSEIRGFAQGPDQLRQFTVSGMLWDEFAFWPEAEATYAAAMPTIEGGGRITIISSAAPGFMKRIVYDELDRDAREAT